MAFKGVRFHRIRVSPFSIFYIFNNFHSAIISTFAKIFTATIELQFFQKK